MTEIKNFVGIDISKSWLDLAATNSRKGGAPIHLRLDNTREDIKTVKSILKQRGITLGKKTLITFETIGPYARPLMEYFAAEGCLICEENALKIKRSTGIVRGKSDKIDARKIPGLRCSEPRKTEV